MPAKSKLLLKSDDPDRLPVLWDIAAKKVKNHLGIQMRVDQPDKADVAGRMQKAKKPFELWYALDKNKFTVELRIGSKTDVLGTFDLASEKDVKKRRATLEGLETFELVTAAEIAAFDKANPDPDAVARTKSDIRMLELELQGDVADRRTIASWKTYDAGGRAGGYDVSALLKMWIEQKKPSWTHYIEFVDDVQAGKSGKEVFDRYAKDGAQYPINLPPALQGPLEKAVAAGKEPDFTAARKLIVKMIDQKFIPLFKKDRLALYDKSMKDIAKKLKEMKPLVAK